jgi:transcriptional regulator with XRE-family HTH domain
MSDNHPGRVMHRIALVRERQKMSLLEVAKKTGLRESELRRDEDETSDLRLSRLYEWQTALKVPIFELLVEPDSGLSLPSSEPAYLLRLMKTATSIRERTTNDSVRILAQTLINHIVEIAPELKDESRRPSIACHSSVDEEYGRNRDRDIP